MSKHHALMIAAEDAHRRIQYLEHALVVAVSEREGCTGPGGSKCEDRRWDNGDCNCAVKARKYLPQSQRD